MKHKQSWEERFDKKCETSFAKGGFLTTDLSGTWEVDKNTLKSFVTSVAEESRKEERERIREVAEKLKYHTFSAMDKHCGKPAEEEAMNFPNGYQAALSDLLSTLDKSK